LLYWGLNSGTTPWATPPALFYDGSFWDRVSQTICPGWSQTEILLISASWVVRITGLSHQCLAIARYLLMCSGNVLFVFPALSTGTWHRGEAWWSRDEIKRRAGHQCLTLVILVTQEDHSSNPA
jgi:hypothetical protein